MTDALLQECTTSLGRSSAQGSSLTLGTPVVLDDTVALMTVDGQICGAEAPTAGAGGCGTIPDLSADMPAADTVQAFADAFSGILDHWAARDAEWTPDVLINLDGTWRPVLPLADPSQAGDQGGSGDGSEGSTPTQDRPWNDDDWNQTCASQGCGLPGLPPFDPGGGLSFTP